MRERERLSFLGGWLGDVMAEDDEDNEDDNRNGEMVTSRKKGINQISPPTSAITAARPATTREGRSTRHHGTGENEDW